MQNLECIIQNYFLLQYYTYFLQKINRTKKTSGDIPNVLCALFLYNYFFLVSVFTFFTGVFFLAGAFTAGVLTSFFAIGLLRALFIGLTTTLLADFLPRYFESSNARIGMKIIFRNTIPIPYAQCFQNLSAILNALIIIRITNTGGKRIHRKFRPDRHPSSNIRYRL